VVDQAFEGGFPILLFHWALSLSWKTTSAVFVIFIIMGWGGAKIFRKAATPHNGDSIRLVRSSSRFREWRACHTALSPFARALNFENVIYYRWFMKGVFTCMGIYNQGMKNALNIHVKSMNIAFPSLPQVFSGYRILFMSDLHIDGFEGLDDRLKDLVSDLAVDLCLLGGDYRMEMYGQTFKATRKLRDLVKQINALDGVFGILGNHDCLEIAPELEDSGIYMLINDSFTLERNGESLCIIGTDDPHYYKCSDLDRAFEDVPGSAFSILLSHSPEIILKIRMEERSTSAFADIPTADKSVCPWSGLFLPIAAFPVVSPQVCGDITRLSVTRQPEPGLQGFRSGSIAGRRWFC